MGNREDGAGGPVALTKPVETHAVISKYDAAYMLSAYFCLSNDGKARKFSLGEGIERVFAAFPKGVKLKGEIIEIPEDEAKQFDAARKDLYTTFERARSSIRSEDVKWASTKAVETLVEIGLKQEEASHLVGKALIDMGLKEPMQKMLNVYGADAQVINAFMVKMRAIAYAKEQKEKAEGDLKGVLAEHNVTEHKYEAA